MVTNNLNTIDLTNDEDSTDQNMEFDEETNSNLPENLLLRSQLRRQRAYDAYATELSNAIHEGQQRIQALTESPIRPKQEADYSSMEQLKKIPPRPILQVTCQDKTYTLTWTINNYDTNIHAYIEIFQIYAYRDSFLTFDEKYVHIADLKPLTIPMNAKIELEDMDRVYFMVRAIDIHNRYGKFSFAKTY